MIVVRVSEERSSGQAGLRQRGQRKNQMTDVDDRAIRTSTGLTLPIIDHAGDGFLMDARLARLQVHSEIDHLDRPNECRYELRENDAGK